MVIFYISNFVVYLINKKFNTKMSRLKNIISILGYILFVIMIVIVGYQVIKLIIGGTWEFQDIIIALLVVIITGLFTIFTKLAVLGERTKYIGESVKKLRNDFREHINESHRNVNIKH